MGFNYIIMAVAAGIFIIGVYETMIFGGLTGTYWLFMLSGGLFLWVRYRIAASKK
jgi:hypothetical protein